MESLFMTSFIMSIIILIVLLYRRLETGRYRQRMFYIIWLVISIRLILPFEIFGSTVVYEMKNPLNNEYIIEDKNMPFNVKEEKNKLNIENKDLDNKKEIDQIELANKKRDIDIISIIKNNLFNIWLFGAISYTIYHIVFYMNYKNELISQLHPIDEDIYNIFLNIKLDMNIDREVDIKTSRNIKSPMVIGLFNPILIIPKDIYRKDIEYILRHELIHIKRHDLLYKQIIFIATIIHWFNPVIHRMNNIAGKDLELSCDEIVIKDMNRDEKIKYSKVLVNNIDKDYREIIGTTNFSNGLDDMKKRLDIIFDDIKKSSGKRVIVFLSIIIISTGLLFGCETSIKDIPMEELYDYRVENISRDRDIKNILGNIVYPMDFKYDSYEIYEKKLILDLKSDLKYDEDMDRELLIDTSSIIYSLIDDIEDIRYNIEVDNGDAILVVNARRNYIDSILLQRLDKDLDDIVKSEDEYINLLNMDISNMEEIPYIENREIIKVDDRQEFEDKRQEIVYNYFYNFIDKGNKNSFKIIDISFNFMSYGDKGNDIVGGTAQIDTAIFYKDGNVEKESSQIIPFKAELEEKDNELVLKEIIIAEKGKGFNKSLIEITDNDKNQIEYYKEIMDYNDSINYFTMSHLLDILNNNGYKLIRLDNY